MEKPNMQVIEEISGNDEDFKKNLLEIIKKEFSKEFENYNHSYLKKDFEEASECVHKLKHKISLLGFKEELQKAALFEKEVKKGNLELHENFIDTLNKINVYLYD
ncbi:Hpt domain-containing protein [Polaribacter marinivivus]|jgi:HPt (histidine-containing phosphotransfer) domain-containing protein|uniref:Hpt domain-containing protein n=1 Tax=Polaribacter marinivivus TaxID=1524260 RepID=A0ABV8R6L0_9FLAO|nr:Hpt domain-containing protein [uncultured Polaribacter sp.]